jgi:DNA-directed RNA polymerase II subunit RPB1
MSFPNRHSFKTSSGLWLANVVEPAIVKPRRWTGKQILSMILPPDISLVKCVRNASNNPEGILKDDVVIVSQGVHLAGRLCKATLGTSTGGFVQQIWKRYGPWAAAKFVSDAQRILI